MKDVLEIFPKVVGKYKMPVNGVDDVKQKCFSVLENYSNETHIKTNGESSKLIHLFNYADQSLLDTNLFDNFEKWITDCSLDFINLTLGYKCDKIFITDCWLNKCDTDGHQFMHVHSNSYISGTYFVNFIRGKHAHLSFQSSDSVPGACVRPYIELPPSTQTKYNSPGAILDHGEGDLLLWESNMVHGYERNYADDRISISFNVLPEVLSTKGSYSFKVTKDDAKLD